MTSTEPGVAAPIVKPLIVTVKAVVITAPAVERTTAVSLVVEQLMLNPETLLAPAATIGLTEGEKKLRGYVSVIRPPDGISVVTKKASVTETFCLKAKRLDVSMLNSAETKRRESGTRNHIE